MPFCMGNLYNSVHSIIETCLILRHTSTTIKITALISLTLDSNFVVYQFFGRWSWYLGTRRILSQMGRDPSSSSCAGRVVTGIHHCHIALVLKTVFRNCIHYFLPQKNVFNFTLHILLSKFSLLFSTFEKLFAARVNINIDRVDFPIR